VAAGQRLAAEFLRAGRRPRYFHITSNNKEIKMSEKPVVNVVDMADRGAALNTIVAAFAADPLLRWIMPKADTYLTFAAAAFDNFGGGAFAAGSAYQAADFAGVALWIPPGHDDDEVDENVANLLAQAVAPERLEEVGAVLAAMQSFHPDTPCWYLPLIGVDPHHQGRGLGAELMKYALARCDEQGLPAYLESSNPANISLYERHGFEVIGRIQEGSSPPVHPMLRSAR
jgi:ribosomal protein S18 acetylase RimI-like enzyme